jgi:hypothetical protein
MNMQAQIFPHFAAIAYGTLLSILFLLLRRGGNTFDAFKSKNVHSAGKQKKKSQTRSEADSVAAALLLLLFLRIAFAILFAQPVFRPKIAFDPLVCRFSH